MVGRLRTTLMLAAVVALAPRAGAFTMGEVAATTGMQGTLAKSGTTNVAGTIGSVKNALGAAVATKQGQLAGAAGGPVAWGGKGGGQSGWASPGKGGAQSGWASPGSSGGWASTGTAGGWASASNAGAGAWASGPWGGAITR